MDTFYSNFLKTTDGEQIFYSTNFRPEKEQKYHDVIIFNYGLVCSNHHWKEQISYFDSKGYKLLIHDYRGHFQSSGIERMQNITFENITNDLFQICNHLNIKSTHVIGHSMGVNISLEFCHKFSNIVKSATLISGTAIPVNNIMFDTNIMDHIRPLLEGVLKAYNAPFKKFWTYSGWNPLVRKIIHHGGFNVKQVSDEFIEVYMNRIGKLPPELFFQLADQMQQHHILAHLPSLKTRCLIMGGDHDRVIPNYVQRLLADQISNCELYLVHKGSHVPQVDFPELINERIEYFIQDSV